MRQRISSLVRSVLVAPLLAGLAGADQPVVEFSTEPGRVAVSIDGEPVATYVYRDPQITRPYFADVRTPGGLQVTRNHPPIEGTDVPDHATYHPGIWMSFGDINGSDFWRIKAPVKQVEFVEPPTASAGRGSFAVRNQYLSGKDPTQVVCEELCRIEFRPAPGGFTIAWDAEFSSDAEFYFGDQEEMGLGFRVATPIRVAKKNKEEDPRIVAGNGTILNADGRKDEAEVWGESSAWCDYSGTLNGRSVGITLLCHPDNFRPSWFHARDYGLLLANAFGREAFSKGEKSKVVVPPGEKFRLRYGVYVHEGAEGRKPDFDAAYAEYLKSE